MATSIEYEEKADDKLKETMGGKARGKKKMNKWLLVSFILGVLYLIYSAFYWGSISNNSAETAEQLGAGIAAVIVMPHLVCTALAVIFNAFGLFMKRRGFALTGAILYTVAIVLFPMYFMFVIVEMISSYIGYVKLKKQ